MKLPSVGERITHERARALCLDFGDEFAYLVRRIDDQPDAFGAWEFDGASMLPDQLAARVLQVPDLVEIALKHDLKYAYGERGNWAERLLADYAFRRDLLAAGCHHVAAGALYRATRIFGTERLKTPFRWGFARTC